MESLWKSFAQNAMTYTSSSTSDRVHQASSFQMLLATLACSHLSDVSHDETLYPDTGAYLGKGATFFVERKEAKGRKFVAVKHIVQDHDSAPTLDFRSAAMRDRMDNVLLEAQALLHLPFVRHQNIVDLLGFGWDEGGIPYLVTDYAELGSLDRFMKQRKTSWQEKEQIAIDVACGLELLHESDLIHGDIKLENLLVFPEQEARFTVKLSDFGCSGMQNNPEHRGTYLLNAPELRHRNGRTPQFNDDDYKRCDVYSYGLALWEILINGKRFYSSEAIAINAEDVYKAEQFLLQLDSRGQEIIPFTEASLSNLDTSAPNLEKCRSVFLMTLARDPDSRHDITDVRLRLDTANERDLDEVIPFRKSKYSIFDMGTIPLPWTVQTEFAHSLLIGANDNESPFAGQDAFNLAACYAFGFGVELDQKLSFHYLRLASKRVYTPATVLYSQFQALGLIQALPSSTSRDTHNETVAFPEDSPGLMDLPLHFSSLIRTYYKQYRPSTKSCKITCDDMIFSFQDQESLYEFLLDTSIDCLQDFIIEIRGSESISKPLMHHLVATNEALAEHLLRKGVDGSVLNDNNVSLLNTACALGSVRMVHTLLELFPSLANQPTKDGVGPLHWLFMFEDDEIFHMAKILVKYKATLLSVGVMEFADLNLIFSGLPLHWAVMARNPSAVQALVELGGQNIPWTPWIPCLAYPLYAVDLAVCLLMPEIAELLIKHGAKIGPRPETSGIPSLHFIGDTVDCFRLWLYHGRSLKEATCATIDVLLAHGADINGTSDDGCTALQWVVGRTTCLTEVMESLLQYNPRFSSEKSQSNNPIYMASAALKHDQLNCSKMRLLLDYASKMIEPKELVASCVGSLRSCAIHGSVEAARELISVIWPHNKEIINEAELLHLAAQNDQAKMIELFLDMGADIDLDTGGTPAAAAASFGKRRALGYLLSHGASVFSLPSTKSSTSLLHEIVASTNSPHESFQTLNFVCNNFKDLLLPVVDKYDDRGMTALHEAIVWGHLQNAALLLEKLKASALCIRNTEISPTTLAVLARDNPPGYLAQQGNEAINRYHRSMSDVLRYLTDTWNLAAPDTNLVAPEITEYWTRPTKSMWSAEDQVASWLKKIV